MSESDEASNRAVLPTAPPPGWFPDPTDPRRLRWWTGDRWYVDPPASRRGVPGSGLGWSMLARRSPWALALRRESSGQVRAILAMRARTTLVLAQILLTFWLALLVAAAVVSGASVATNPLLGLILLPLAPVIASFGIGAVTFSVGRLARPLHFASVIRAINGILIGALTLIFGFITIVPIISL